ncbi:hypothetical protein ACJZ2D_003141 [Fusarium nematophilum]
MLMESQPPSDFRKFQPISVGKCYVQTAADRFGDGARGAIRDRERSLLGMQPQNTEMPFTWPGPDSDDERRMRNADDLSQLYFAAYQGRIFVYRPRTVPTQALPRHPDLQLKPQASAAAGSIGGQLDMRKPHLINHIITGFLGDDEIVLACYDDGDVVGYHIKDIAKHVFCPHGTTGQSRRAAPRLFFHENVGISAWGLAIHQKSRLIAVSSNRHEVIVFALALTPERPRRTESFFRPSQGLPRPDERNVRRRVRNWMIVVLLGGTADNVPNISFADGPDGHADRVCAVDIRGSLWLASIWRSCEGPICIPPLDHALLKSEEFFPSPSSFPPVFRGWGVFTLHESNFMKVKTTEELFGLPTSRVEVVHARGGCHYPLVNVRSVVDQIPGNPCRRPQAPDPIIPVNPGAFMPPFDPQEAEALPGTDASEGDFEGSEGGTDDDAEGPDEEDDDDDEADDADDSEVEVEVAEYLKEVKNARKAFPAVARVHEAMVEQQLVNSAFPSDAFDEVNAVLDSLDSKDVRAEEAMRDGNDTSVTAAPIRLDMTYLPHCGEAHETPRDHAGMLKFLRRPMAYNLNPREPESRLQGFGQKFFLLRTYETDIELRPFSQTSSWDPLEVGVVCPNAVNFGFFREPGLRHHFHATSRLNMIALAPELSLLAVGSPTGRVALLTLTRKAVPLEREEGIWEHGFRVEWILPTRSDEEDHRKVLRPLHGMAMGPVQVSDRFGEVEGRATAVPRRYRLMLHYRNHDILSYELTREEQTGKLCIF